MELLRGPASQVSPVVAADVWNPRLSLTEITIYTTTFLLAGRVVRLEGVKPPVVISGDEIVVVGDLDRAGVLEGIGYVNVTRSVGQMDEGSALWSTGGWLAMAFAILFGVMGIGFGLIFLLGGALDRGSAISVATLLGSALVFWIPAKLLLRRARRVKTAVKMINDESLRARGR